MLVFEEDGKYFFAPGGNLTVFLSNSEMPEIAMAGGGLPSAGGKKGLKRLIKRW